MNDERYYEHLLASKLDEFQKTMQRNIVLGTDAATATNETPQLYTWNVVKDGDTRARGIFDRHYSRHFYRDGRKPKLFVGPGSKLVLLTPTCDALFIWRKFISGDGQQGVNCAVFRNEGRGLSSALILDAERIAWERWPGERLYTYVAADKVASSNPGYCFKVAGWHVCGKTKRHRHLILEKTP